MKTTTFFLLICALLWAPVLTSREPDSSHFLKLRGKIMSTVNGNVTVQVMVAGQVTDSFILQKHHRHFITFLRPARYYTLRIRQLDTYPQSICIDTRHFTLTDYEPYEFSFQTSLVPVSHELRMNEDLKDCPVAIVYYDRRYNKFDYNKSYTSRIKRHRFQKQVCSR